MAKLPGYDSQRQMSTEAPTQMRDMAQEQQMGKNIQALGTVARDLSKVWQAAEDAATTLEKQNQLDEAHRVILDKSAKDPDYKNSEQHRLDLDEARENSLQGFSNNEARSQFAITANNQTAAAKIKVDGIFRGKLQQHYQGEIVTSHDKNKRDYIAGDLSAKEKQEAVIAEALEKGAINKVFAANESVKIAAWDQYRYIQMAQDGQVREALALIDASTMQPSEKNAAKAAILASARQGEIIAQVNQANKEQQMYAETDAVIDDPNKTFVEKLDFIEKQKTFGLPDADAKELTKSLYSENRGAAERHADAYALILLSIDNLDKGITDKKRNKKDIKTYLQSIKSARSLITNKYTEGVITLADKKKLLESLQVVTEDELRIATGQMKKQGDMFGYGYKDAHEDFLKLFEGNVGLADEALVELYQRSTEGKWKDGREKKEVGVIKLEIDDRLRRETVQKIFDEAGSTREIEVESSEDVMKRHGVNYADIEAVAKERKISVEKVIQLMRESDKGR
jgi:hypothetical protein